MPNLSDKFAALRTDEANSIYETNALLRALRGEGDGTIVDLLNAINLVGSTLVDIRTALDNLNTTVEILNNNASTNAQQTISAVINSSCGCDVVAGEPPYNNGGTGNDCDAYLFDSVPENSTTAEVMIELPEGTYEIGPPIAGPDSQHILHGRYYDDDSYNFGITFGESKYRGDLPAGLWFLKIENTDNDALAPTVIGWCWQTGTPPPDDTCARAQAVVAGFEAILAGFANMSDSTPLTNTAINLAFAKASPFIAAQPPDSLTRQNLINLWSGASGGFHYGLLPSGLSSGVRDALIAAVYNASNAESAGIDFLDVLETQLGIDAPYLDFAKSIPQQFWFNAVFNPFRNDLNVAPFDNELCGPS